MIFSKIRYLYGEILRDFVPSTATAPPFLVAALLFFSLWLRFFYFVISFH